MSALSTNPFEVAPVDGDMVVCRESQSARYTVGPFPSASQFSVWPRHEAIQIARRVAQKSGVDDWYSENGMYWRLDAYRQHDPRDRLRD